MRYNEKYRNRNMQLRDGFYIEVCNKGTKKGMKIRSASRQEMDASAAMYTGHKDVNILGEYKDGLPVVQ